MKVKCRTTKITPNLVTASTGWEDASLVMLDRYLDGQPTVRVVLAIRGPSDLAYVRERLDEIEAGWKRRLGVAG